MKLPIVGLIPLWDEEKKSLWMLPGYMEGLSEAGCVPIVFPLTNKKEEVEKLVQMVDGILITGGQDVSPTLYGEEASEKLGELCPMRDTMESLVLECADSLDKPVLGICRGLQFINAFYGGTLYQDLPSQHPSDISHRQQPPYDAPSHNVDLVEGEPLQKLLSVSKLPVNSCHHQAIKDLAPSLRSMAVSEDGLVEAVYNPESSFFWAVQWHPEFMHKVDEPSRAIFRAFANAMRK